MSKNIPLTILTVYITVLFSSVDTFPSLKPLLKDEIASSLGMCILAATEKYIIPNETMTVSLPLLAGSQNETEVLLHVFKSMELPLLTIYTNITEKIRDDPVFNKISKSYLIFVNKKNDMKKHMQVLRSLYSWNFRANFLFVSTVYFPDKGKIVDDIITFLKQAKVLNAMFLLASKENSKSFDVYTWSFLEQRCRRQNPTRVDYCSDGKYHVAGSFIKKFTNYEGCIVLCGYVKNAPFVINTIGEGFNPDAGIEIDILNMISDKLNLKLGYIAFNDYGTLYPNGSATDALGFLKETVDMAIGGFTKTAEMYNHFSVSYSYDRSHLVWCVPHHPLPYQHQNMLTVINWNTWILLFLFYLIINVWVWHFSRKDKNETQSYRNISNAYVNFISIFIGIAVNHPKTVKVRTVWIGAVVVSFYLNVAYQTYLTSIFSDSNYTEKYDSWQDIAESNLNIYHSNAITQFFADSQYKDMLKKWQKCNNYEECLRDVALRKDAAFCVPELFALYHSEAYRRNNTPLYCFHEGILLPMSVLMSKEFPLFEKINDLIARIAASGIIKKWVREYSEDRTYLEDEDTEIILHLHNLKPIFVLLVAGNFLAFVVFVGEVIHKKCVDKLTQKK